MKRIFLLLTVLVMTGCGGVDPEDREYALGMFIGDDVIIGAAKLSAEDEEESKSVFYRGHGDTPAQAIKDAERRAGSPVYLGQLFVCVLEKDKIDRKKLEAVVDMFASDDSLSRGAVVFAADDIDELVNAKSYGGDIISYIRKLCEKGTFDAGAGLTDTDALIHMLAASDGDALLPVVKCVDGVPEVGGGAVIENYKYKEEIGRESFEHIAWLMGKGGAVTVKSGGTVSEFRQKGLKKIVGKDGITFKISAAARILQEDKADKKAQENIFKADIEKETELLKRLNCDCLETETLYKNKGYNGEFGDIPITVKIKTEWKG